jgi:predicted small metal-binding protein
MLKWLISIKTYFDRRKKKNSSEPYVEIISEGIDNLGRLRIEFDWNDAFIKNLRDHNFDGNSEEEIVKQWFEAITNDHMKTIVENNVLATKAKISSESHPDL